MIFLCDARDLDLTAMRMTTSRLVALRVFNVTLGRFAVLDRALRKILVRHMIHRAGNEDKYVASSRFFDPRELD